jgi:hypothetical protein
MIITKLIISGVSCCKADNCSSLHFATYALYHKVSIVDFVYIYSSCVIFFYDEPFSENKNLFLFHLKWELCWSDTNEIGLIISSTGAHCVNEYWIFSSV